MNKAESRKQKAESRKQNRNNGPKYRQSPDVCSPFLLSTFCFALFALFAVNSPAQTPVQFWFTNVANPNWAPRVTVIPSADTALQTNGFYVVASMPVTREPTNGTFIVPLWTGNYTVKIEGMPISFTIAVPNTNIVVNASTLTTNLLTYLWTNAPNGLISAHWVPGWGLVVATNMPGTAFEWLSVGLDPSVVAAGSQTPWNQPINANQQPLSNLNWLSLSNGTTVAASDNTFGQGFRFYPSPYWLGRGVGSFGWQDNGTGSLNSANGDSWFRTDTNDSFMVFDHTGVNLLWSLDTTNDPVTHKPRVLMPAGATVVANPIGSAAALTNQFQLGNPANVWVILDGDSITASPYNYSSFVSNWPAWSSVALWKNFAHPGDGLEYLTNKWNSTVAPFIATAPPGTRILYSVLIGANDYDGFIAGQYGGPTNWVNLYNAYLQQVHAAGAEVVAHTFPARLSYNGLSAWAITNRAIMNAGIVASTNWDWLVPLANILPNCLDTNASNPLATFNTDATHPTAYGQFKWAQAWDAALRQPARHQEDVTVPQTGYGFDWIDPSGALALHADAAKAAIPGSLAVGGPITVAPYQPAWVPDWTYPLLSWYQVSNSLYSTNGGLVSLANLSAGPAATNSQASYDWSGLSWPARIPAAANGYDTLAMTNGAYLEAATTVPGLYEVIMVVRLDDWTRQGVMQLWSTLPANGYELEAWEYENDMTFGVGGESFFGGPLSGNGVPIINTNGFYVWDFVGNGASSQILTNGIQAASGTVTIYPAVYSGLVIGNGSTPNQVSGVTWEWPEMLTFTNVLTPVQRASLVTSLIQKYNVYGTNSVVTIGTVNGQSAVVSSQFLGTATNATYAASAGSALTANTAATANTATSANTAASAEFATTASSVSANAGQLTVEVNGSGQSIISSTSNPLYLLCPSGTVALEINNLDGSFWIVNENDQVLFQVDASDTTVWTPGFFAGNGIYITNLAPAHIAQDGATPGQALVWNGDVWIPATVSGGSGGGSLQILTNGVQLDAAPTILNVTSSGGAAISGSIVGNQANVNIAADAAGAAVAAALNSTNPLGTAAYRPASAFDPTGTALNATNGLNSAQLAAKLGAGVYDPAGAALNAAQNATNGLNSAELAAKIGSGVYDSSGAAILAAQNATNGAAAFPATTASQNATNGLNSAELTAKIGSSIYDASGAAQNSTNPLTAVARATVDGSTITLISGVLSAPGGGSGGETVAQVTNTVNYLLTNGNATLSVQYLSATNFTVSNSITGSYISFTNDSVFCSNGITHLTTTITNGGATLQALNLPNLASTAALAVNSLGQVVAAAGFDPAGAAQWATNTAATTWPTDLPSQNATNGAAAWPTSTASQNATNGAASWPSDTASHNATNALNAAAFTGIAIGGDADEIGVQSGAAGAVYIGGVDAKSGYQYFTVPSSGAFTMDLLNAIMYGGTFNGSFVGNVTGNASGSAGSVAIANVTTPGQIPTNGNTTVFTFSNNVAVDLGHQFSGNQGGLTNAANQTIATQIQNATNLSAAQLVAEIASSPVARATGDGSGNSISGTYATQSALASATNGTGNIPMTVLTSGGGLSVGAWTNSGASGITRTVTSGGPATINMPTLTSMLIKTNAAFSLSCDPTSGSDAAAFYSQCIITNNGASKTPFIVTVTGAAGSSCLVTGGWANAFAVTNGADVERMEDGQTNLIVILH